MKVLTVAGGELRERLRGAAFLALLVALAAGATWLVPSPHAGYDTLSLNGRAIFGPSGFAGTGAGLAFAAFASLAALLALDGGFSRDERTGLAELLRAMPIATAELVLGRLLAVWALGGALVVGSMLMLGITLLWRDGPAFDGWTYARNFLILALPATLCMTSLAVLLDLLLGRLRGALIAAAVILWLVVLTAPFASLVGSHPRPIWFDIAGMSTVESEYARHNPASGMLDVGLISVRPSERPLWWSGLAPAPDTLVQRLGVLAIGAVVGALALAGYRRRIDVRAKADAAVARPAAHASALHRDATSFAPPSSGRLSPIGRLGYELAFRLRKHLWLAGASAALFALGLVAARPLHHAIVAAAILLPLFWTRAFGEAFRPRSLDETLGALPGGLAGDLCVKGAVLAVACAAPLLGLLLGNPHDPASWFAATLGVLTEVSFLIAVVWVLRAELLGLAVVALLWYVVAFNSVPAPVDFAGAWHPATLAVVVDFALATACVGASALRATHRG